MFSIISILSIRYQKLPFWPIQLLILGWVAHQILNSFAHHHWCLSVSHKDTLTWSQSGMQTAQQYPLRELNSSVSSQTHWPRTKLHHLLMNSTARSACCCGQVISLNSGKDQRQHFLSCPLVVTSQEEVTDFTGWEKERNSMKLSQQPQNHSAREKLF